VRIVRRSASRDSVIDRKKPRRKVERSPRGINPTHAENALRLPPLSLSLSLSLSLFVWLSRKIMDMEDKIFSRAGNGIYCEQPQKNSRKLNASGRQTPPSRVFNLISSAVYGAHKTCAPSRQVLSSPTFLIRFQSAACKFLQMPLRFVPIGRAFPPRETDETQQSFHRNGFRFKDTPRPSLPFPVIICAGSRLQLPRDGTLDLSPFVFIASCERGPVFSVLLLLCPPVWILGRFHLQPTLAWGKR